MATSLDDVAIGLNSLQASAQTAVTLRRRTTMGGLRIRGGEANSTTPAKLPGVSGVDYQYPALSWYSAAYALGVKLFRVSSVPSRTRGSLLDAYMAHVAQVLAIAPDVQVVLDPMHCYGVDSTDGSAKLVLGAGWSTASFGAQWGQIASHATFKANADRIVALDLLNEPTRDEMPGATDTSLASMLPQAWQAAVTAIRAAGYHGWVLCQPHRYAKALEVNATLSSWSITDPDNRVAVCLHYYFDNAGVYGKSYTAQLADILDEGFASVQDKTDATMAAIQQWRTAHPEVPVWLGEVGWGPGDQWDADGRYLLSEANRLGLPWVYDSLAPNGAWQTGTVGAMEPFATAEAAPTSSSPLTVTRDQGRALTAYAAGDTAPVTIPATQGGFAGQTFNALCNPNMVSGGAKVYGLNTWSDQPVTWLTSQTGWADGVTTAGRVTIATANQSSGNGLQQVATVGDKAIPVGDTIACGAQVRRSSAGRVLLQIDWLDRSGNPISGAGAQVGSVSASAGVVSSIVGTSKPRPAGGVKVQLSVLSDSAAAGETIDATGLWVGAQGSGDLPGWHWIATANHGASVPVPVVPVADTTDFAALLDPVGGGGGGGSASQSQVDALQAKVDAMPALAVVTDPAQAPAGSIAVVAIP